MEFSLIGWTDHTFNPWIGCTKHGPGCLHCYAEQLMDTRFGRVQWGPDGLRVRTAPANWKKVKTWQNKARRFKQCMSCGWRGYADTIDCPHCRANYPFADARARVFCASLADVAEYKDDQPEMDDWRRDLFDLINKTPALDWLLLTKRPDNLAEILHHLYGGSIPRHIHVGATFENQRAVDTRLEPLLDIPAATRFGSFEPLLEAVTLPTFEVFATHDGFENNGPRMKCIGSSDTGDMLNWVIVGGESHKLAPTEARPLHPDWARSLLAQCRETRTPYFFKQWGEWKHMTQLTTGELLKIKTALPKHEWSADPEDYSILVGKDNGGRELNGRTYSEFPATLRVAV